MIKIRILTLLLCLSSIYSLRGMEECNVDGIKRFCIEKASNEQSGSILNLGIKELNAKNYESAAQILIFCFITSQDSIFKALSATYLKTLYKKNKIPKKLRSSVEEIIKKDKTIKYSIVPIKK